MDFEKFSLQKSKYNSEMGKISLVNTMEILPISELNLFFCSGNCSKSFGNCFKSFENCFKAN